MGLLDSNRCLPQNKSELLWNNAESTESDIKKLIISVKDYASIKLSFQSANVERVIQIYAVNRSAAYVFEKVNPYYYMQCGDDIIGSMRSLDAGRIKLPANTNVSLTLNTSLYARIEIYLLTVGVATSMQAEYNSISTAEDVLGISAKGVKVFTEQQNAVTSYAIDVTKCNTIEFYVKSTNAALSFRIYGQMYSETGTALADKSIDYYVKDLGINSSVYDKITPNIGASVKIGNLSPNRHKVVINCSDFKKVYFEKRESDSIIDVSYNCLTHQFDEQDYVPQKVEVINNTPMEVSVVNESPIPVSVIPQEPKQSLIKPIIDSEIFSLGEYKISDNNRILGAVHNNIVVFYTVTSIYISTTGVDGDVVEIELNSDNFPNLIENSRIRNLLFIPYTRRTEPTSSHSYYGRDVRLCVFTTLGQIYHNFPSRAQGYDGVEQEGDIYKFDESVVWDSPLRQTPVKSNTGDDASLISTGVYKYMPCFEDSAYEMCPPLNIDNGYGNGGFGAIREFRDKISDTTIKCPRFFLPVRKASVCPFQWMGGVATTRQLSVIGTYTDASYTDGCRVGVFSTSDGGREWFVSYEFGAHGGIKYKVEDRVWAMNAWANFSGEKLTWGENSVGANQYNVVRRWQYIPSVSDKAPDHKFVYDTPIPISSIVSTSEHIIITTSSNHGYNDGDIILFTKQQESANSWDWLVSYDYTEDNAGDGNIWKVEIIDDTSFYLRLEIHNPHNELSTRHVHSINSCKDGFAIGCGEEYPNGWILYMSVIQSDAYSNMFAGNQYPIYRLTNTVNSIQRILGIEIDHDGNWICGLDTSYIKGKTIILPNGETMPRSSTGVFEGNMENIDNYANCQCLLNTNEPAYFFKKIMGKLIFIGQRGLIAISKDKGVIWDEYMLDGDIVGACQLIGQNENTIFVKNMGKHGTLVITLH